MMLELLKVRFSEQKELHPDLEWSEVEQRLREVPAAITILQKMEETGGEPDTIGYDVKTGKLIFCDCAKESQLFFLHEARIAKKKDRERELAEMARKRQEAALIESRRREVAERILQMEKEREEDLNSPEMRLYRELREKNRRLMSDD